MHSDSKTSTFSSEVQVHFPVSHCAHRSDCVKTVPFCRAAVLATVPKQRKEGSQLESFFGLLIGSLVPVTESSSD